MGPPVNTNKAGFDRIVRQGVIRAGDRGRVFGENARNRPLSPREAERRYGLGRGRGNHYIETDVPNARISRVKNPRTGAPELQIRGDVPLRNASGRCQQR
ncbi:MAG: HYD1 signature containing ADP-ribosyltransferase family protein [Solirubrobacteraceae bacterium]